MTDNDNYPVDIKIDHPETSSRLTVFFRIILAVPVMILLGLLAGSSQNPQSGEAAKAAYYCAGFVIIPTVLMILFRKKYPKWWFDWNLELLKFSLRVFSYMIFLTNKYPSTDEEQDVHVEIAYPDVQNDLQRGMPLVKWFLAIPHYIILGFLVAASVIVSILAWFAVIFTAKYPSGLHDFVVGVIRWGIRVNAYAFLLVTDKYPPFSLK